MKNISVRIIAFLIAAFAAFSCVTLVGAGAADINEDAQLAAEEENSGTEEPAVQPQIIISAPGMEIVKGKQIKLEVELIGFDSEPELIWETSDPSIAAVGKEGTVIGANVGRAVITATAIVDGKEIVGGYPIRVVTRSNIVKDLLVKKQVLSYKYSYTDDYYYTNDKECWQSNFGFNKLYDIVAPYVLMEYDYVRVHFTYEEKDWMIQLWKGQYGLLFYGCEMGVYNKPHSDKKDRLLTTYSCAPKEDWLNMEMTMYHDKLRTGYYEREFTRDYGEYWWCTGFKDGHLLVEEPANELRMVSRITLKDEEMTRLFSNGLIECEFTRVFVDDPELLEPDQFCVDGNDVYFKWQDISAAENTMPIKIAGGMLFFLNIFAIMLAVLSLFGLAGLAIVIL